MNYPITELDKIAPGVGERLKANKIRTTNRLLEAARTHKKRLELAKTIGVPASAILRCTTMSDRLRVKGIGREHAELAGTRRRQDGAGSALSQPANLAEAMAKANAKHKLMRVAADRENRRALDRTRQKTADSGQLLTANAAGPARFNDGFAPLA